MRDDRDNKVRKFINTLKYILGVKHTEHVGPFQITTELFSVRAEELWELITFLEDLEEIERCPECDGKGRFGFQMAGTGTGQFVGCRTCDWEGYVKKGTPSTNTPMAAYEKEAKEKFWG